MTPSRSVPLPCPRCPGDRAYHKVPAQAGSEAGSVHTHVGNSGVHAHVQAHALAYTHRQLWASRFCTGTPAPQSPAACPAEAGRWLPLGSQRLESEGWAPSR